MKRITSFDLATNRQVLFQAATAGTRGLCAAALSLAAACALMTGCAGNFGVPKDPGTIVGTAITGSMHGGQQPIAGASVQLYAASLTGYGAVSTPLLTTSVLTDATGSFNITNDYTCPSASTLVYLVGTGGNPSGGINANAALMAPLGPCGNLSSSTYISINELTTIAGAFALSPFMANARSLGTSSTNVTGLTNAFATVNKIVNIATGGYASSSASGGAYVGVPKVNTLADILAACINSTGGVAGDGSNCGVLFANTTAPGGVAPTDTIMAALNMAKYPGSNVATLSNLPTASAPFQPTTTFTDFTLTLTYAQPTVSLNKPSASAVDSSGNVWVTNSGGNSITILPATTGQPTVLTTGSLNAPSAIAFDQSGNAWVPNSGNSTLSVFTPGGDGTLSSLAGLNKPTAIAIDGQNNLWITNSGNSSVTEVTVTGTTTSSSTSVIGVGGIASPVGVAINAH